LLGFIHGWVPALFSLIAFVVGAVTSIICGFVGMRIAVYSNSRTALQAAQGYTPAFATSFKAGCVMGFALCSLALLVLFILVNLFSLEWSDVLTNVESSTTMYECISGYGLGGSSVALFGRVGGGIYTKAADVGADLVGKVERDLPEDDPRNPAVIADNVGDNVGDIAGMGADLFGSFAESACAAMVIAAQSESLHKTWGALCFPLVLASVGIVVCILTSFVATHLIPVTQQSEIEPSLKRQILVSTLLMTPAAYVVCYFFLPSSFDVGTAVGVKSWHVFICVATGLWSGMVIGYITEYYTSHSYTPVREVADACKTGAATNIIYGLALGYKSVIVPTIALAVTIYVSYSLAGMFGIASAALGILSPLSIDLTIDAYGPICDNAGGIAEMAGMPEYVRERTDALDGAGNTTAAIGKGFAIGSAAFVSLALFGAFVTTVGLSTGGVDILQPFQFAGLLVGAMLPYWFSAMTMKSVGFAAKEMVEEVRRQFRERPGILNNTEKPDYKTCVAISTEASLKEMLPPGALVMLTPLIVGFLFGVEALAGLLAGALVSGVQMAISSSNTGGAWDNAKKYIAAGGLGPDKKKHSDEHKAAVIGDTVGDPLKDTSGPSLNILIKLMAIISLVFAPAFPSLSKGGYLKQLFS
jgi:H(+)-translocating pyrophosphatase